MTDPTPNHRLIGFGDTPEGTTMTITHSDAGVIEVVETRTTDDKDAAAHIVWVPPNDANETSHSLVLRARIEGFEVTALCGYRWIPRRDPKPLPVCEECFTLFQNLGSDDRDTPPEP